MGTAGLGIRQALLGLAAFLFLIDLYLIFQYAPTASEALGLQVQRIFYFHVPSALLGMISFAVAAFASVVYLAKSNSPGHRGAKAATPESRPARFSIMRVAILILFPGVRIWLALRRVEKRQWDRIAWASAEVGTVFFTVAIGTGAIWAKPLWQTWWVWDVNGTLTFMLWLVFIGYLIVRSYAPTVERGSRWAAVVAIFGAAAVPFVYMAADWWEGLHTERITGPGASGSMQSEIFVTFMFSLVTFLVLFIALVAERTAQRGVEESIEELRREVSA
ncbi:MAG: cytochrome c biogenesis protein CcsA [Chloroflexi bacterium]|nr:cytochrome c biogenesis protein CcsA [Chloroflexota bacterium]MDA1174147.1 cytochrome c biogenesis protein CcsA [Chloroflexota bacterium]